MNGICNLLYQANDVIIEPKAAHLDCLEYKGRSARRLSALYHRGVEHISSLDCMIRVNVLNAHSIIKEAIRSRTGSAIHHSLERLAGIRIGSRRVGILGRIDGTAPGICIEPTST